ncbi:hypothetical protein AB4Y45_23030 [Paraburkholderia sp. EG287A]|uniref:hypothetical protein n=1 Tax=Paraburkholderia sp. EG287A TaxID=3237012 RepID=UPI0034D340B3
MLQRVTNPPTDRRALFELWKHHIPWTQPNDVIKELFAEGDDQTSHGASLKSFQDYALALKNELGISTMTDDTCEAIDDFTKDVVMAAGWYQHRYLCASKQADKFIIINALLVVGMPIAIIVFGTMAAFAGISATPSQIAALITGVFALQKTLSTWYAQRQQYATWYSTSCGLKDLYTTFIQKWAGHAEPPSSDLLDDMRKSVAAARALISTERMAFYKALTPPSFDMLSMITTQQSTVATLVSNLLPVKNPPDADAGANSTAANSTATDGSNSSANSVNLSALGALESDIEMVPTAYKQPATPPALTDEVVDICFNCNPLRNAADVNRLFGGSFISWFNTNMKGSAPFLGHNQINTSSTTLQHFMDFWNQIPNVFGTGSISAPQFIALMCINIQECLGNFWANPELVGKTGGLKYCYEAKKGIKNSYNTNSGNLSAYTLFTDDIYVNAHKGPDNGYDQVVTGGVDPAWKGGIWPTKFTDDSPDAQTDFIAQCDFYKLRGRGVIQTTTRSNYRSLLQYLASGGIAADTVIMKRVSELSQAGTESGSPSTADLNRVLTECKSTELDDFFSDPRILAAAVCDYIKNCNDPSCFQLSNSANILGASADIHGSYFRVGSCINGGNYPAAVSSKIIAMTIALARYLNPNVGVPRPARTVEI